MVKNLPYNFMKKKVLLIARLMNVMSVKVLLGAGEFSPGVKSKHNL